MEIDTQKLVKKHGSILKTIEYLISEIVNGNIEFPYAINYLPTKEEMFHNLDQYQPKIELTKYKLYSYYPKNGFYSSRVQSYPISSCTHTVPWKHISRKITNVESKEASLNLIGWLIYDSDHYHDIDGLTDHFTESVRNQSKKVYDQSVSDAWSNPVQLYKILHKAMTYPIITEKVLRDSIYHTISEPGLFKLTWLKGILTFAYGENNVREYRSMLDISAGWGDRLLIAAYLKYRYLGFDPNKNLKLGHDQIIKNFGSDIQRVEYIPFEDAILTEEFDLVLSSPPYFDLEIYHKEIGEHTQSIVRYPTFNQWMKKFLFIALKKAWTALKVGGYFMIHMGDTYNYRICEPMNLYIDRSLPGSYYHGVIGVAGVKKKACPIWIWQKSS